MPTDKRARQRAARQARLAELRRAQQRRRNLKRGGIVVGVVVIALVIAVLTVVLGGNKKPTHAATKDTSSTTSTTAPASTSTTTVAPLSAAKLATYLVARTPPAHSAACSNPTKPASSTTTTTLAGHGNAVSIVKAPKDVGFPALNGSSPRYTQFSSAPPFCINVHDTYTATMKTTAGTMKIELLAKYAPVTVNNFVFLAGYHFFDGIVFHRVIPGFVDQGGDPTGTGEGGPGYTIPDEYPKAAGAYDSGSLAMANTGKPHTGGSQFFITVGNGGAELQPSYTMFGQVVKGLNVAYKINAGGDSADNGSPPKITYKILSVSISASPSS
ncbi:MAG TPA: peptidylprolyl isomerase [Acidimicrobiales bacterium]|nr:peptidylprolyl isomerase [Acidimicrobiales bacterium]